MREAALTSPASGTVDAAAPVTPYASCQDRLSRAWGSSPRLAPSDPLSESRLLGKLASRHRNWPQPRFSAHSATCTGTSGSAEAPVKWMLEFASLHNLRLRSLG